VWRYRELVAPDLPAASIVARGEGNTGLYPAPGLAAWVGLDRGALWLKHEGENPTGSFKDRGMCVGVSAALARGARVLCCASTGNTSASLASYAALAGVPAVVFVPAGKVALGKLAQTLAYGARVLAVRGSFDDAMRLVDDAARAFGLGLLNSVNPWRVEGQKAIALELLDDLAWTPPDWIVLPSGNLGNISALGKGLREARRAGLIDRLPRLAGVQAAGAAPFARFMADPARGFVPEPAPETVATAIRIGDPRSWEKARREVEETRGRVLAVSDEELLEAKARIDAAGVGCEPASATSVAGLRRLVAAGEVPRDARVVAILTGHLLKDPETTIAWHEARSGAREVDPTLEAIGAALGDLAAG
jgi:threonine synthase